LNWSCISRISSGIMRPSTGLIQTSSNILNILYKQHAAASINENQLQYIIAIIGFDGCRIPNTTVRARYYLKIFALQPIGFYGFTPICASKANHAFIKHIIPHPDKNRIPQYSIEYLNLETIQ